MKKNLIAILLSFLPVTLVTAQPLPAPQEQTLLGGLLSFAALLAAIVGLIIWYRSQQKADTRRRSE